MAPGDVETIATAALTADTKKAAAPAVAIVMKAETAKLPADRGSVSPSLRSPWSPRRGKW